jgi:hypothetical protein
MTIQIENMDEMVVKKAIKIINKLKGVLGVQILLDEDRKTLKEMESKREGDMIPVVNRGLNECLEREFYLAIFKNIEFRYPSAPTVLLVTDKGRILGKELITNEEKKKYQDRSDIYFLSKDFIFFKSNKSSIGTGNEKEFFLLPPVPFPELKDISSISNVTSCSPSTMGDSYLKNKYGYPQDPKIATIIVGFSKTK